MTVAFPRGVFGNLKQRFNEEMPVMEDWEYLVRAASIVGVEHDPAITSVYRWWVDGASSRTTQSSLDWSQGQEMAYRSFNDQIILLPRGSAHRISEWRLDAAAAYESLEEAYQRTSKEHVRLVEEYQRTYEEHVRLADEYQRTYEEHVRLADEYHRTVARVQAAEAKMQEWGARRVRGKLRRTVERFGTGIDQLRERFHQR